MSAPGKPRVCGECVCFLLATPGRGSCGAFILPVKADRPACSSDKAVRVDAPAQGELL